MKKILYIILVALFFIWPGLSSFAQDNKFVPPDKKVIFIVGQDKNTMREYVTATKTIPAGFMVYTSLQNLEGLLQPAEYGSGTQHAQYFARAYPTTVLQIGLYLVGALMYVPTGAYDVQLEQLANWFNAVDRPVYLRIGYEFDLPSNHYSSSQYLIAYRYIVDFLRRRGVQNVAYVWHSYAGPVKSPVDWYPGDEYVDWVALSYFDTSYESYREAIVQIAREHKKPLMIAEATPRGMGIQDGENSWQKWFVPFFDFIEHNDVKAVCYINSDWEKLPMFKNQGWGNARIQDNLYIKERWLKKIKASSYLGASKDLFAALGYK
ncbi:MAG: glycosyl hydrolase [Candidatus Omnitrophota bacterium]